MVTCFLPKYLTFVLGINFIVFVCGKGCGSAEYRTHFGKCCPMCEKGSVVSKDCTQETNRTCILCSTGSYMNKPNGLNKCFQCKSCHPGQGLQLVKDCTKTNNAFCDVIDGYFCQSFSADGDCSFALKRTICAPGHRTKQKGPLSDVECEDCRPGYYSEDGLNCTAWTDCGAFGQQKIEDGSLTKDVVCKKSTRIRIVIFIPFLIVLLFILFVLFLKALCGTKDQCHLKKHHVYQPHVEETIHPDNKTSKMVTCKTEN